MRQGGRPAATLPTAAARWAGATLLAGAIAAAAWKKRSLTPSGALAATVIGTLTFARGGLPAAVALNVFFVTSSALSRFKTRQKARRGVLAQAKGSERDARQVLANGGVAAACLGLSGIRGTGAFLGAMAAAGADTWATELGLLAPVPPRLITTLRPVPAGTSGGVTPQGTLAALAGATAVGAGWAVAARPLALRRGADGAANPAGMARPVLAAALAGTAGAFVDSLLGATVQAVFWCPTCREPAETPIHRRCGQLTEQVRGWRWMDNDAVNAFATATGALLGALLWRGDLP